MSALKRHFKVIIGNKEHGLYTSSTPSSAAKKAVSKLCADNKNKKVEFSLRETTQGSNKKIYGPYLGYMQKLDKPIELEGRVIRYKPIAKLKKKSRKMKGGVEILGEGKEGIVLRPNINQSPNNKTTVSKLITATQKQKAELIAFEENLNDKDKDGIYHVKMLSVRSITEIEINAIQNISQARKNEMKKYNLKITYQYGGISIEEFLDNFEEYSKFVNSPFIQSLLRGIVNCFQGLYVFYDKGIVHSDLHKGNIVFLLEHPEIMRMIDWGIFLPDIHIVSYNNFIQGSVPNSSNLNQRMGRSLIQFYDNIRGLFNEIKLHTTQNIKKILDDFLKLLKSVRNQILKQEKLEEVRRHMVSLIRQVS